MNVLVPGIDGMVSAGKLEHTGCCPPSFADVDECTLATAYIGLLPSGPLWDRPKYEAITTITAAGNCAACWTTEHCPTLVDYAVNVGARLASVIDSTLWPAVRESDPFTAVTSTADWLDRFGWVNCFETSCRSSALGEKTPIEYMTECGPVYVQITYPPSIKQAFESALIKTLERLSLGIVKNLAAINFVLEPLKVRVVPLDTEDACENETLCVTFEKTSDFFDGVNPNPCGIPTPVAAYIDRDVMQLPSDLDKYIWPGHMAAECIVRSLLSHVSRFCVVRTPQTPD